MQREAGKKISEEKEIGYEFLAGGVAGSTRMVGSPGSCCGAIGAAGRPLRPPPALQVLLQWLERGQAIALYSSA